MDEQKAYASDIAAEAVGERLGGPPPDTREQTPTPTAASAGPRARVAEKTAESLGERSGDAYADATTNEARERSRRVFPHAATEVRSQTVGTALSRPFDQQTFVTVLAAFALGFAAALLIHRARQVLQVGTLTLPSDYTNHLVPIRNRARMSAFSRSKDPLARP